MNMVGLSSSVRIAHIACYWKVFLLHYTQVLCQYRLCKADHTYLTYLMLQRQRSHLNGRKLDQRQVSPSYIIDQALNLVWLTTSRHGPRRKHSSSIVVLPSNGRCSFVCFTAVAYKRVLFQSRSLATAVSLTPQLLLWGNMPQYFTLSSSVLLILELYSPT
jgi:hypothetical protein